MSKSKWSIRIFAGAMLFLSLSILSCMKPALQVQYYRLSTRELPPVLQTQSLPTILVGPVRVDSFLGQGPLVKQNSGQSSSLLEQHHWTGQLDEMLSRLIIQNMNLDLKHEKIYSYPESNVTLGVRVEVDFFHFEKDTAGNAFLEARWKIIQNSDQSILFSSTANHTITPEDAGFDALTSGLSLALAKLCREIANSIIQLQ